MKRLFRCLGLLLLCALFPYAAEANNAPAMKPLQQTPSNVEIVGGKRFYSLQNVRRFTGGTNSPRALSVIHHPHPDGTVVGHRGTALPLTSPSGMTPPPGAAADKDKLLSIFAPDEKAASPAIPTAPIK